jgi:hypothetical protein
MATKSMNNNFQIWNTQTLSHIENFQQQNTWNMIIISNMKCLLLCAPAAQCY